MKNENEIKRAFAMEVIEWIKECKNSVFALSASELELKMLQGFQRKTESLLPKEEEVDWSNASELDKLKYAAKTYKKGSRVVSPYQNIIFTVATKEYVTPQDDDWVNGIFYKGNNGNILAMREDVFTGEYLFYYGKWAEIVEPENKNESDEVKDIITTEMVIKAQQAVLANHRDALANPNYAIDFINSLKQPTLEQRARKKAEEMYYKIESSQEAIYQALLIDPKTL